MHDHHQYISIAKQLRKTQMPWEAKLWHRLRSHRLLGLKFKRQVPIGPFVVDFCCNERRLVVELDGSQHVEPEVQAKDVDKQKYLERNGYLVLHFWNNDIDNNIEGVLEVIQQSAFRPLS